MKTHSPAQTQALAQRLAPQLRAGDVLLLWGDLGAGKSEFTRGLARGLNISGPIPSPSFTIMNVYEEGRVPLYHFDWYRLESSEELYEMGLDEFLGGDGIAVVEWPSRCPEAIPQTRLDIRFIPDGDEREIILTPRGDFRAVKMEEAHEHSGN